MANQVVWFDIPVKDLDRAIKFYGAILNAKIEKHEFDGGAIGVLPHEEKDCSGCLTRKDGEEPSDHGPLLYLNAEGRLDEAIAAVVPNGGKILQPRHSVSPYGFRAVVLDSEGNRLALHSM